MPSSFSDSARLLPSSTFLNISIDTLEAHIPLKSSGSEASAYSTAVFTGGSVGITVESNAAGKLGQVYVSLSSHQIDAYILGIFEQNFYYLRIQLCLVFNWILRLS